MMTKNDTPIVLLSGKIDQQAPSIELFKKWVQSIIDHHGDSFQVSIEIVDQAFSQQLNRHYRGKDKPTNVLSFPLDLPEEIEESLIGDLAICETIVRQEAFEQNKPLIDHWAHMVIHGTLHLLGYDHITDEDADIMEALEITLLSQLNIANPYTHEL